MPTTIKLKNGSGAPLAGDLVQGEPALDLTNKRLYTEDSGGTVIEVGTNPTSITTGTIDATTITADGLTVHNTATNNVILNRTTSLTPYGGIVVSATSSGEGGTTYYGGKLAHYNGEWRVQTQTVGTTDTAVNRLTVGSGGDISFYEDTGTTAKFFWDASAGS